MLSKAMERTRSELTEGWVFKQEGTQSNEWLPVAKVPTQVHMDLLANKQIADPFVDLNERSVQWIGEKVWVYKTSFKVPQRTSHFGVTTDLVFEGLDTFATVILNGIEILKTDNMFVRYRVNVSEQVKHDGDNHLELYFDSALLRGRDLIQEHPEHTCYVRQTEASRIPVRKAQYNWGWDWGPILITAGPWKPVFVEQYTARIDDFWAQHEVSEDLRTCSGIVHVNVSGKLEEDAKVVAALEKDGKVVWQKDFTATKDGDYDIPFEIKDPSLWYPLGYGSQSRYTLTATLTQNGDQQLDSQSKMVGFRRTELVQEPDGHGKSFYFRINGTDTFAGGSCWVPADSYLSAISAERYRDWIRLMAEGNQVMIRIWGGGAYEHDALLDACDEFGVSVWHDFQFACGSYPAYPAYLETLEVEARQQVRRLRWHPSVIIWAGNNEDYQVQERYQLEYDYENKDPESWLKSSFPARYIYEHFLPKIVQEEDPHMIYHPSSPWGDGKNTADPTVGDIHQWNIWHGMMYKYQEVGNLGGRFVSEFGMEAYPHMSTVRRMASDPSQLYPGSMVLDFHNKAINHERRLMTYIVENFRPKHDLESYAHLSQVVQADTMRAAYKTWRRQWGKPKARQCGGVLVWQLNDCWPTMSWAVVDYFLIKKPAYYAIARALRQIDVGVSRTYHDWTSTGYYIDKTSELCTGQVDQTLPARKGKYDVWIASSDVKPVSVEVTVRFISVKSGSEVSASVTKKATAEPNSTTDIIVDEPYPTSIPDPADTTKPFPIAQYDPYVIYATVSVNGTVVSTDTSWPDPVKFLDLSDRGVSFETSHAGDSVSVTARKPVKGFVFEEMQGLKLSDNGFDVIPGVKHTVRVEGKLTADKLRFTYVGAPEGSMGIPK